MAEIKITGNKLIKTVKAEFQSQFEYLGLGFYSLEDWKRANNGGGNLTEIDPSKRISEVRTIKPESSDKEISIHGRTLVKNLENNFKEIYGICVQVCYEKDGHRHCTWGKLDDMSLTQFNKWCSENGYTKHPK